MRVIFIKCKKNFQKIEEKKLKYILSDIIKDKRKKINIFYTIQYYDLANVIYSFLNKYKKDITLNQLLGCSKINNIKDDINIFIGDGTFHLSPFLRKGIEKIYIINETLFINNKKAKEMKINIKDYEKEKKSKILKFLHSEEIGIIISLKKGQNKTKLASILYKKLEKIGKKPYLFIGDTINIYDLENYPIKIFINTACPGLEFDSKKILNYEDILNFLK